jgi:hypothetical protein
MPEGGAINATSLAGSLAAAGGHNSAASAHLSIHSVGLRSPGGPSCAPPMEEIRCNTRKMWPA